MKSKSVFVSWTLFMAGVLLSCTGNKVYDRYVHTPVSGWEKNDTLVFNLQRMADSGDYASELGLRVTSDYPFMGLTLIVDQWVYPARRHYVDTLNCKLMDAKGNSMGVGMSYYQFRFPIRELPLHRADSVVVKIRHDMKREILPGISDVGYLLRKE